MAKSPSQCDLARSGPRGGFSGGELSGGLGGSDRPGGRGRDDSDRPRSDRFPGDDDRDPTRKTGIGFLDAAEAFFQQPQDPPSIVAPTERPGSLSPSDRSAPVLRPRPPAEEEDPPIVPGDPDDLGARGRRRRTQDDRNPSPVLRRGLLGV